MFINKIVKSAIIIVAVLVACFIFNYDLIISNNKKNRIGLAAFFQRKEVNIALAEEKSKKNLPNYPFKVGEKLKYGIYSAGLKVGELTITYFGSQ